MIAIVLGLAWVVMLCMVVGSLTLGYAVGHKYVFTAPGVSRTGPRVGRRLASIHFSYQGAKTSLRELVSQAPLTLLVFLGHLGVEADEPHIRDTLIPDIRRFAALSSGTMQVVILGTKSCERIEQMIGTRDHLRVMVLADEQLMDKLTIRAMPYAVLLDRRATVRAKGLVNHFQHLCLVTAQGGKGHSDGDQGDQGDQVKRIIRLCHPFLPEDLHVTGDGA